MPIYEIECQACGRRNEVLANSGQTGFVCPDCGSDKTAKVMSAPSSLTGRARMDLPGPSDRACCGSTPAQSGCAGPGSCCGRGA